MIQIRGHKYEVDGLMDVLSMSKFCPSAVFPNEIDLDIKNCPKTDTSPAHAKNVCKRCWWRHLNPEIVPDAPST